MVGCQTLVHRCDDGGAAAHAGFKQEGRAVFPRQGQQFGPVGGDHFFIGSTYAAAALQAAAHIGVGKLRAADGLHHHPDLGVRQDHIQRIGEQGGVRGTGKIPHIQNILDFHRLTGAAGNGRRIAAAYFQHAAADGTEPHNCNFRHWSFLSSSRYAARASGPAVDLHHTGLVGKPRQHFFHRHLHHAGAHGHLHLGRAVFRAGLGDGDDGRPRR